MTDAIGSCRQTRSWARVWSLKRNSLLSGPGGCCLKWLQGPDGLWKAYWIDVTLGRVPKHVENPGACTGIVRSVATFIRLRGPPTRPSLSGSSRS
jgi:hypothetical protein